MGTRVIVGDGSSLNGWGTEKSTRMKGAVDEELAFLSEKKAEDYLDWVEEL